MSKTRSRHAFTLIELLVVIAIIAVLIAILLPAVQQARAAARRTHNRNNMKQLGIALHTYHDMHRVLPSGWIGVEAGVPNVEGRTGFGWGAMLLPMLDQGGLYNDLNFAYSIEAPENAIARDTVLPVFRSPSDPSADKWDIEDEANPGTVLATLPTANYIGNFGTTDIHACELVPPGSSCDGNGIFFHNSDVGLRDLVDGTGNTFVIGERRTDESLGWHSTWVGAVAGGEEAFASILGVADHTPNHPATHFDDYSSYDEGGVHFLFGDGHVRFLSENIDLDLYQGLATRNGKEVVGEF